ncbi:MAG: ABC transporter ATP-binding protein [Candidatus Muiribacteriota bacterium]
MSDNVNDKKKLKYLSRLLPYFKEEKSKLVFACSGSIIVTATHLARPLILRYIIDTAVPAGDTRLAINAALLFIAALIFGGLISYTQIVNLAKMGVNIVTRIKNQVFSHILSQDLSFFDKHQPGRLMARTESDIERLKNIFTHSTMVIIQSILMLVGIFFIIFREEPVFGFAVIIALPPFLIISYFYMKFIMKVWTEVRKKNSFLSGYITEYVQATPIIQLFSKKKKAVEMLMHHSFEKFKHENKAMKIDYLVFWSFVNFVSETLTIIAIFYYGTTKIFAGKMSVGSLVMYTELLRQLFQPIRNLMMVLSQIQGSLAAASRVFEILDTPSKVYNNIHNTEIPKLNHSISFNNISFAYDNDIVIDNVSFKIEKGEHVAIIGPSGSGKTTIINLLLRFYDLKTGEILIDNKNIDSYRIDNLRKDIGLVLQDVFLFPGTILENLKAFNGDIPDETAIEAAKKLGAHELILSKPEGYNTMLSEKGGNLSMGERQLISFTRAFIKNPDILILDEATSSVDVITESILQKALKKLMENRTAIIIAHRLSTIKEADRIFVFENGKIIETGNHEELFNLNGLYRKLYSIQEVKN